MYDDDLDAGPDDPARWILDYIPEQKSTPILGTTVTIYAAELSTKNWFTCQIELSSLSVTRGITFEDNRIRTSPVKLLIILELTVPNAPDVHNDADRIRELITLSTSKELAT